MESLFHGNPIDVMFAVAVRAENLVVEDIVFELLLLGVPIGTGVEGDLGAAAVGADRLLRTVLLFILGGLDEGYCDFEAGCHEGLSPDDEGCGAFRSPVPGGKRSTLFRSRGNGLRDLPAGRVL